MDRSRTAKRSNTGTGRHWVRQGDTGGHDPVRFRQQVCPLVHCPRGCSRGLCRAGSVTARFRPPWTPTHGTFRQPTISQQRRSVTFSKCLNGHQMVTKVPKWSPDRALFHRFSRTGEPGLTRVIAGQTRFPGHATTGRERRRRESNPGRGLCRPLPEPLGHVARCRSLPAPRTAGPVTFDAAGQRPTWSGASDDTVCRYRGARDDLMLC